MKRLYILLLCALACASVYAQKFNGVEMSGNRTDFTSRYLKNRPSASVVYKVETETAIKDKFLDSQVTIYVQRVYGENSDNIWCIWFDIIFPKSADWTSMIKRYDEVLAHFTKQYGDPHPWLKLREFDYPYNDGKHVGNELSALKYGKCNYSDTFFFNEWKLHISLQFVKDVVNSTSYNSIMVSFNPDTKR